MNLVKSLASVIILALISCMSLSCNPKTVEIIHSDPYENITANNIIKECPAPVDYHFIPGSMVVGTPMKVIRFKDCLTHPDLLIMSFPGENTELIQAYAHLMMLLYIDSTRELTGSESLWSLVKISQLTIVDGEDVSSENEVWFIVYKLSPKVIDQKNSTNVTQ